jgi:glycosyltransferase involved in cell wall biosynthesis
MLSVGINAQLLSFEHGYRGAGISSYLWRLLQGLAQCATTTECTVFARRQAVPSATVWPAWMRLQATDWPTRRAMVRLAWEALALPLAARGLDLVHAPVNVLPPHLPCPGVVTIHDLAFLRFPELVSSPRRRFLTRAVGQSAQRAAAIIAVSASTRQDVMTRWHIAPERVHVVYPAIDAALAPVSDAALLATFAARHDLARPYILFMGTLEPRKNLATLIEAFGLARAHGLRHTLVLAGAQDWQGGRHTASLRELIHRRHLDDVVFLPGYVADAERSLWYSGATVVVMPSWYEGFGFPAAEALACGVPVIAADAGSLPEVVGTLGRLCPPGDVAAWAGALGEAVADVAWRDRCGVAAAMYRSRLTETAMAQATLAIYRQVAQM